MERPHKKNNTIDGGGGGEGQESQQGRKLLGHDARSIAKFL